MKMQILCLGILLSCFLGRSSGAETALPAAPMQDRLVEFTQAMYPKLRSMDGVGGRLCSQSPAVKALCHEWKRQILEIAAMPMDPAAEGQKKAERDLLFLIDTLLGAWADEPAAQADFIEQIKATPRRNLHEYALAKEKLAALRNEPWDLTFTSLDGRAVDLAQLRGKPFIVQFWALGCSGCRAQLWKLKTLYTKYHPQGLEIVGLTTIKPENLPRLEGFIEQEGIQWPQRVDREQYQAQFDGFAFQWVSNLLLFDTGGRLLRAEPGPQFADWENLVRQQLQVGTQEAAVAR